jgi:hypothetical protein
MKRVLSSILMSVVLHSITIAAQGGSYSIGIDDQGWSKSYEILFSAAEQKSHNTVNELYVEKVGIASGTQLVFGWNAHRPDVAQFTFFVRTRNAHNKEWSSFHKLVEWGGTSQTSFSNTAEFSKFLYARLEIDKNTDIDGFGIKIIASEPKILGLLAGVFVTVSNFKAFVAEKVPAEFFKKKYICVEDVPLISQILLMHPRSSGLCSPTSSAIVTSTLLKKSVNALEFSDYCYDRALDMFGNWPFSTAHMYEHAHEYAYMYPMRLASISALYNLIEREKCPIVVSIKGTIKGGAKPYPKGHLLVVIGFDPALKKVICHDPAFREINRVRCEYNIYDFIEAWERSNRMTYKVIKK